jgi:hypothetical protein
MDILERARKIRKNIVLASSSLDDKTASETPELFGRLNEDGELVRAGSTINWNGSLKRAAVDLWDTNENNPDNAPTLWNDISYKDGVRIIPETITITTMFSKDEMGWWKDSLYKSLVDNNVYNPEQYSTNWESIK